MLKLAPSVAVVVALAFAAPLRAEVLPDPYKIALPEEQPLLRETFGGLLDDPGADGPKRLATLDAALARLGQPSALRGFVQFLRATALWRSDQHGPARNAIEESIRLLPGYSGPLFAGAEFYTFSDQPGRAADYFLRASRIDPTVASRIPDYNVNNLVRRLRFGQDQRRVRALSDRLIEIDWRGEGLTSRSAIARQAIEARMADGDVAGARALVPKLLSPGDARTLLLQRRYEALWADVERWAGLKLERLWPQYLAESREKWRASGSYQDAVAYAWVLEAAGHDRTIVREFLPLYARPLVADRDHDLLFLATTVAGALAREGRWADIEALYDRAARVWPLGKEANALNLTANRARYALFAGDAPRALRLADAAIADAARWGDEVNRDALANMHWNRACALHAMGRGDASIHSRVVAVDAPSPVLAANLHLCLDKPDAARELLVRALGFEDLRDEVLAYVQPSDGRPFGSEYGRASWAKRRALSADPKLLTAVAAHGRVLPFSLSAGAPPEATE